MNVAAQMLEARPDARGVDHAALALAIDALHDVVSAATTCADSCLSMEGDLGDRREVIQACGDAADVAGATAKVLCRTGPTVEGSRALVDATAKILSETESICADFGVDDKHARICADTTRRAEQALAGLKTAIAAASSDS
jgi:hypothetical protein